jgi:hypothetical protein
MGQGAHWDILGLEKNKPSQDPLMESLTEIFELLSEAELMLVI